MELLYKGERARPARRRERRSEGPAQAKISWDGTVDWWRRCSDKAWGPSHMANRVSRRPAPALRIVHTEPGKEEKGDGRRKGALPMPTGYERMASQIHWRQALGTFRRNPDS